MNKAVNTGMAKEHDAQRNNKMLSKIVTPEMMNSNRTVKDYVIRNNYAIRR